MLTSGGFMKNMMPPTGRQDERGIALIVALLLLLLVSAIGLGMLYMSNTETSINANYRDSQSAFFSMRAGLEEARDRMRTNSPWPITPPAVMPGSANSILYTINPAGASDTVDPVTSTNLYFDDELCHEAFSGMVLNNPGANIPCTVGAPSGFVSAYVNSVSPNTNTASALKFKWVRLTLKQNGTFANGVAAAMVDAGQPASAQVCYQTLSNQEVPLTLVPGGAYASCSAAQQAGQDASPVYIATSLAITPQGSRRIGQYEMASVNVAAPPVALGLDGPAAVFTPTPSSNNYFINGTDSGLSGYTSAGGTGTCNPSGATVPAITVGDSTGVNNITTQLQGPPNRTAHYTGSGASPSIVNGGGGGTGAFSGEWSTPAQLDALVSSIANVADVTYSCGIGAACSPTGPVGTNANPQITYVNGDFNFGNGSGAGVLVVTGTLSFTGNATFNGLILIIGQGALSESGGGNGGFNGSVFLAKTHSSTSPYPELASLGTPTIAWNGGGNSFIQYNSCWATIGNGTRFTPISTREEMY
jgi:PilX N-terminal